MLANLKKRLCRQDRRAALFRGLTQRLMDCLARQGSLVLEPGNMADLDAGREQVLRAVYALLLGERLHLTSNDAGQAVAMSNHEFESRLRRRAAEALGSGAPDDPLRLAASEMETPETFPLALVAARRETPEEDRAGLEYALEGIFAASARAQNPEEGDGCARRRPILPLTRQSLPERRREPWATSELTEVQEE